MTVLHKIQYGTCACELAVETIVSGLMRKRELEWDVGWKPTLP